MNATIGAETPPHVPIMHPHNGMENGNGMTTPFSGPKKQSNGFGTHNKPATPFTFGPQVAANWWPNPAQYPQFNQIPDYPPTTIYIRNLRASSDEVSLWREFSRFGTVIACKVLRNNDGTSRRAGFVQFSNRKEAETAMAVCNNSRNDTNAPAFARLHVYWAERPLHISIANGNGGLCTIDALQSLPLHPAYRATIEHMSNAAGCNYIHYHRHPYTAGAPYVSYGVPVTFPYSSAPVPHQQPQGQHLHPTSRPFHPAAHGQQQQQHAAQYNHQQTKRWVNDDGSNHQQQYSHQQYRRNDAEAMDENRAQQPTNNVSESSLSSEEKKAIRDRVKKAADSIHQQQQTTDATTADVVVAAASSERNDDQNEDANNTQQQQQQQQKGSSSSSASDHVAVDKIPTPEISEDINTMARAGSDTTSDSSSHDDDDGGVNKEKEVNSRRDAPAACSECDDDDADHEDDCVSEASSLSIHLDEV